MPASNILRVLLGAGLAAFAIAIILAKGGALVSGYDVVYADNALRAAAEAKKGVDRDKGLASALRFVDDGLAIAPQDPRLWALRSETLLRQALDGAPAARQGLIQASVKASQTAVATAPNDSATQARYALVLALDGDRKAAAEALTRSYDLDATALPLAHRRLEAAGRSWKELGASGQRNVVNEACILAARSPEDRTRMQRLRFGAADAGLALALDQVLADSACRQAEG